MKQKFSILTKVGVFYLLFTLISLLIAALILQDEADEHMHRILEKRIERRENWIKKLIEHKPEKIQKLDFATVNRVKNIPADYKPVYSDTTMMQEETQRKEVHRKRISYITVNDKHYRLELTKEADELYRFRDDIFEVILPVFAILALIIIVSNYLLSGYLFKPFQQILKQMAGYKIGNQHQTVHINSSTKEFDTLQQLYNSMHKRIENDYFQLKEFTENMSHELQTPLSIIQNKTEQLLSDVKLTQNQAGRLKTIYDETKQLSRMGSALNLITKIENNEFSNIQEVRTSPVILEQIKKTEEFAAMRSLTLQTDLNENHVFSIDPGLFEIMLRNLLKNALHYSAPDTTLKISTGKQSLTIQNYGEHTGFSGDEIFNRFKKGKNSKSMGLGLAIVKKICLVSHLQINYQYAQGWHTFTISPVLNLNE